MHHHVALDDKRDVERLFRFINGTAVGLVACGGGAFCAAHIGVYKALAEMNVGFDIMGGTSAGSAMVAAFVLGTEPDEIEKSVHDMFVAHKAMRRYTWPRYSLLDHTNFDQQLKRYFDGFDIEDLWLPYFAVSTNLSRFRLNRHRTGSLWTAIRASSSIPVLLPPVYTHDGEMLVDGCLLDNVPVRTMQDIKSGPNVVVSFAIPELERFDVAYETLPSRAELVRLALNPMKRDALPAAPGLIPVLLRSLMASRRDFQRDLAADDVLLVPPVPKNMGFLDWQRHRELCRRRLSMDARGAFPPQDARPPAVDRRHPGRRGSVGVFRLEAATAACREECRRRGTPTSSRCSRCRDRRDAGFSRACPSRRASRGSGPIR